MTESYIPSAGGLFSRMSTIATCGCSQSSPSINSSSSSPPTIRVTSPNASTSTLSFNDMFWSSSTTTETHKNTPQHRATQTPIVHKSPTPVTSSNLSSLHASFSHCSTAISSMADTHANPFYKCSYTTALIHEYGFPEDPNAAAELEAEIVFEAKRRASCVIKICEAWFHTSG